MMCLHGVQQLQQRLQAFVTESLPASQQGSHFVNGGVQFVKNFCIVHSVHPGCAHRTAKQKNKEEIDIKVACILHANVTKPQRMHKIRANAKCKVCYLLFWLLYVQEIELVHRVALHDTKLSQLIHVSLHQIIQQLAHRLDPIVSALFANHNVDLSLVRVGLQFWVVLWS